jgi:hypothetical protein
VRDWTLGPEVNATRSLTVTFANPIDGQAVVVAKFIPRSVPATRAVLRFPRVVGAADAQCFYGLRFTGVFPDAVRRPGTVDLPDDSLTRNFGAVPELQLDKKPVSMVVRPSGSNPVELHPILRVADPVTVRPNVRWMIGRRADVVGEVGWTGEGDGPAVIPIDVPERLILSDLTGPDWHARTRAGSRVEVWLKQPSRTGTLTWRSSLPITTDLIDLPIAADTTGANRITIHAVDGWDISVLPAPGLSVRPLNGGGYEVTTWPGVRSVRVQVKLHQIGQK